MALLLAGLAPTDFLSVKVRLLVNRYALKAIPYAVVWLMLCRDLLTRDFARTAESSPSVAGGGRPEADDGVPRLGTGTGAAGQVA